MINIKRVAFTFDIDLTKDQTVAQQVVAHITNLNTGAFRPRVNSLFSLFLSIYLQREVYGYTEQRENGDPGQIPAGSRREDTYRVTKQMCFFQVASTVMLLEPTVLQLLYNRLIFQR